MNLSKQIVNSRLTRFSLVAGLVIALGLAVGWSRPKAADDEMMAALGLKSGELVTIDQVSKSEMAITMNGQDYMIDYALFSNRSKRFRLLVQTESGLAEQVAPTVSTVRGALRGVEGSRVIGCVSEEGCCARIKFPRGEDCFIEPVNRTLDNPAMAGVHVVYSKDDLIAKEMQCGTEANLIGAAQEVMQNVAVAEPGVIASSTIDLQVCELFLDSDFEYFQNFGSISATLAEMELIFNIVNDQYESEVGIRHAISEVVVRTTINDPYTASDASGLLNQFRAFYTTGAGSGMITVDLAHLFTGRDLDGSVIGQADIGTVCFVQFGIGFGFGVSQRLDQLSFMTNLVAHELGHNWNQFHCTCPNHTMNPVVTGANDFNDTLTVPNLIAFRNSRTCLDSIGPTGSGAAGTSNNDDLANRIAIASLNFSETGANFNATTEHQEPDLVNVGSSVWWSVNADANGTLTIDTFGSDFDTELHVYEFSPGDGFDDLILVDENDDMNGSQSQVTIDVTEGTHYQIRVGGFRPSNSISAGSEGNIVLNGVFASSMLLGDVNLDGAVNFLDIAPFIGLLFANEFQAEADIDENGSVDFQDIPLFAAILSGL